jgi:hypothetical protein
MQNKQVMAVSKAEYRGVTILETESGFSVILNGRQYDLVSLGEAKALIDTKAMIDTWRSARELAQ